MSFNLYFSDAVIRKIELKHLVTRQEINECFYNRAKGLLEDNREQHKTEPATMWFIAETDAGRLLKVVFMERSNKAYEIKTAYEPNTKEVKIYEEYA
jgi:uncharacterized DUF497 family protein